MITVYLFLDPSAPFCEPGAPVLDPRAPFCEPGAPFLDPGVRKRERETEKKRRRERERGKIKSKLNSFSSESDRTEFSLRFGRVLHMLLGSL